MNEPKTIATKHLDTVTGGGWIGPAIGIAGIVAGVGTAIWNAGHEKGVASRSCPAPTNNK